MSETKKYTKKALFVATVYSHLANFHQPAMRLLQEWGFDVHTAAYPDWHISRIKNLAQRCWELPFSRSLAGPGNLRALIDLRRMIKEEGYDLIHINSPISAFLTRLAVWGMKRGPIVYTVHGFHFFRGASLLNWLLYFPVEWLAGFQTDALIVMNDEDYRITRFIRGVPRDRIFLLPGAGVPVEQFLPDRHHGETQKLRSELGIAPDGKIVICVGELNRNKNQLQLLKAWPRVLEDIPDAHLLLVGEGAWETRLKKEAAAMGLKSRVHFLGFRKDVPALLALSDMAALTSLREGLPRAVIEAMAAGKPVVATDTRGNRDLVEEGQTGFVVSPGDCAATAERVIRLLDDQPLARAMGEQALQMSGRYSEHLVLERMADIYKALLTDGAALREEG